VAGYFRKWAGIMKTKLSAAFAFTLFLGAAFIGLMTLPAQADAFLHGFVTIQGPAELRVMGPPIGVGTI
jgi:hypothetical protein